MGTLMKKDKNSTANKSTIVGKNTAADKIAANDKNIPSSSDKSVTPTKTIAIDKRYPDTMPDSREKSKRLLNSLFWILPILVALTSFYFLKSDGLVFIKWYLTFFALGAAFLPLTSKIFADSDDCGYLFSKPLAMAIAGFTIWSFSYLRILPFRLVFVILIVLGFTAFFYLYPKLRTPFLERVKAPKTIRVMALQETLFVSSLLFWSFARGLKPLLDSLEKPMNYGFMMSIMRTDYLPALDMWYTQGKINYYYFGQFIYSFITKLSGLTPDVSYNLSLASTFALTLTTAFAIGYLLLSYAIKRGVKLYKAAPTIGGLIGAYILTLGGNSHSFFYGTVNVGGKDVFAPGYKLLEFLKNTGLLAKWNPPAKDMSSATDFVDNKINGFFFPDSTRFIGYNPSTHDKTIHEFPYYSFLVADLHAHLINLTFVLLFIGILIVLLNSKSLFGVSESLWKHDIKLNNSNDKHWFLNELRGNLSVMLNTLKSPIFLLCSVLLGIFMMCNFWDFAVYVVVLSMTLLILNLRGFGRLGGLETVPIFLLQVGIILASFLAFSNPVITVIAFAVSAILCFGLLILVKDAFTITGALLSLFFFVSHLLVLPFNMNFDPMSKSIKMSVAQTPLYQLFILYGAHVIIGVLFLVFVIRHRAVNKADLSNVEQSTHTHSKVSKFLSGMNPLDFFVCGLFVCGFIFMILPEIIYVVDIYSGDFKRANTMFKFAYQAFVMMSLVIGYAIARIVLTKPSSSKFDFKWSIVSIFMILLLLLPGYYTKIATDQWLGDFTMANYKGLNGVVGLPDKDRNSAIAWINKNIKGQPVLLEAYGDSYTEANQLSAYTGLPTVMGWQTHEWLWRTSKTVKDSYGKIVRPRQVDVETMYNYTDDAKANALFTKYKIEYIAVGKFEKTKFPALNETKLKALGDIAFTADTLYIIKVRK
jgi:YYY domain-containing protein